MEIKEKMKKQKAIIFDSGSLISLAMNGLFEVIRKLEKDFPGDFYITPDVKKELIDIPIRNKKFELEALRLNQLVDEGVLKLSSKSGIGIKKRSIEKITNQLMESANGSFKADENLLHIVDKGEISCIALSKILSDKGIENVIAIDERTARLLVEKPENLKNLFKKKFHKSKVFFDKKNLKGFKGFKIIRSSELVYLAYKKGFIRFDDKRLLDALLYAVKFKGCAITGDEIKEIKKLAKKKK